MQVEVFIKRNAEVTSSFTFGVLSNPGEQQGLVYETKDMIMLVPGEGRQPRLFLLYTILF